MDGKTHKKVGKPLGLGYAAYSARNEQPLALVIESMAGWQGGKTGARLHDIIEPATSPNHRGLGHSLLGNGAVVAIAARPVGELQTKIRTWAHERVEKAQQSESVFESCLQLLGAATAHAAVGWMNGVIAGAGSHLLLDATTPRGLPILMSKY